MKKPAIGRFFTYIELFGQAFNVSQFRVNHPMLPAVGPHERNPVHHHGSFGNLQGRELLSAVEDGFSYQRNVRRKTLAIIRDTCIGKRMAYTVRGGSQLFRLPEADPPEAAEAAESVQTQRK